MTLAIDAPVTITSAPAPLSVPTADYRRAVDAGARLVDLRDPADRRRGGALLGALAVGLNEALDALTPGQPAALRSAIPDAQWLLISEDGHDAEQLAWHLQARGVHGARFVIGGHRALRAAGVGGTVTGVSPDLFA
ncbi:MAG: rhodanese-like domain-containing protein [Gordonia sp. (in: high G+C Gram-positive bacteria)]|uniref:rhodanese-like domain-containing protein n=1 Tax=Gordonia sp. (in: high G+C Gram-positive bacteria) TaxID=84139 RepID=UPI0039E3616B